MEIGIAIRNPRIKSLSVSAESSFAAYLLQVKDSKVKKVTATSAVAVAVEIGGFQVWQPNL